MAEIAGEPLDLHTVGVAADHPPPPGVQHRLGVDYSWTAATTIRFLPSSFAR